MTGDADIVVEQTDGEVSALVFDEIFFDENENPYVWTVKNETIQKTYIEVGLEGDLYTEIKTQIEGRMVIPGASGVVLKEGSKAAFIKCASQFYKLKM